MKTRTVPRRRTFRGFTLVELLATITVVVILAALTVGVLGWIQRTTAEREARVQLQLLQSRIEAYVAETGGAPDGCDESGLLVYRMLYGDGLGPDGVAGTADDEQPDGVPDAGARVFLADLDPSANPMGLTEVRGAPPLPTRLLDPFGNPWQYRRNKPGMSVNPDFDLWSMGPDGVTSTADDIRNW